MSANASNAPQKTARKGDGEVGYAAPPRAHRFKPGQSGNPKGRPKGAKNESTILRELMQRKIPLREGGKTRKVTVLEGMLIRFIEDSLTGNTKSGAFLLNRYAAMVSGDLQTTELDADDHEILEAFARRYEAKRNNERGEP